MSDVIKNIAFIPARGGSKSIKLKNIKEINGRPLIYWTIDAAVQCEDISEIYVSTDSNEIREVVEKYGSEKLRVVDRSEQTATDTASTESAMIEFAENNIFDNIILIQATSPLLKSKYLDEGLKRIQEDTVDSVLSVVRQKRFIWNVEGNLVKPCNYNPLSRPRRQEFEGYLVENGAFYITNRERLLTTKCRISGNITAVEMLDETYFEIDEPSDWSIIEELLKTRHENFNENIEEKIKKIKAVFMDSDGVLTDGGMYYAENGDEFKKFNTKDGMAVEILRDKGIITGIITGENRELVKRRAEKLKVNEILMGIKDKIEALEILKEKYNLKDEEIAYIGDDINDLEVIKKVGLGCCVNDAMEIVKENANYITKTNGGQGAVREVTEIILKNLLR